MSTLIALGLCLTASKSLTELSPKSRSGSPAAPTAVIIMSGTICLILTGKSDLNLYIINKGEIGGAPITPFRGEMAEGPFTPFAKFKYEVIISKVITPTLKNIEKGGTDKAEFANTWSQLVITTDLFNQVIILKGLCFRNEEAANLSADKTMLVR